MTVELVGRSSSHFTRTARIFAFELGVPHTFRPLFDLASHDAAAFAGNPALKMPILVDEHGALFGTENICRELVRRRVHAGTVVMRGELADRAVANAEELVLHAMAADVAIVLATIGGDPRLAPAKLATSLANCLDDLDAHLDAVLAALPADRLLSFFEVALYCLVRHLPFRKVLDVARWTELGAFCDRFDDRASAQRTVYRFDP